MRHFIVSAFALVLIACGGGSPPSDPSATTPTAAPTNVTGDPTTTSTSKPASSAPATGGEGGKCKSAEAPATPPADLAACKAGCEKLDDKAPEGSRCIPPRVSCKMNCDQQFKK